MGLVIDDRGYSQGFAPGKALEVRTNRRSDLILKKMAIRQDTTILEIGCGRGEMSYLVAKKTNAELLGVDLCVPFIEEARKKHSLPNLKFEVLDFNKPKILMGQQFDYIIGNGILHHLYYNIENGLKNMRTLLKNNGKIIFMEPNLKNPYIYAIFTYPSLRKKAKLEPDEMAFTRIFIRNKLETCGFSQIEVEYRDFLLPNTPDILIKPFIMFGNFAESMPVLKQLAQSLFIIAAK
jgi:SAM-dependent methyltransferase